MSTLNKLIQIAAIPLTLLTVPACGTFGLATSVRIKLLAQLDATHAGKQDDGSYIKCIIKGPHSAASMMAKRAFEERSDQYDASKKVDVEKATKEKSTCARAFHKEMGAKVQKTDVFDSVASK